MNQSMADGRAEDSGPQEDTRLLLLSRQDPYAFSRFYERNSSRVLAYFYRRTFCPTTSGELTAETFAQAYEWRRRFDPANGGSGRAWLFGIAGHLHKDWVRRAVVADRARRRLGITTPTLLDDDLEQVIDRIDLSAMRSALQEGLAQLSPRLRDAVLLRVALDVPYVDVAEQLGCTVGAARVRVSRALDHLHAAVETS